MSATLFHRKFLFFIFAFTNLLVHVFQLSLQSWSNFLSMMDVAARRCPINPLFETFDECPLEETEVQGEQFNLLP